jgi:cytochrome c biogenesis protein CcmG, thiol:disulfide interchange protein DsbE
MKELLLAAVLGLTIVTARSQEKAEKHGTLPSVNIKSVDGSAFNTSSIGNEGKPIMVCFWATWCKPCVKELTAISDVYGDWVEETGVKIYAVSIDDARSSLRVQPFVNGRGWDFQVLLDENSAFRKAMNVVMPPHTFILNANKEIVYQHPAYVDGDEKQYIEVVRKVLKGEEIKE